MPLLWLSLSILAGVLVASALVLPAATWLTLGGLTFMLWLLGRRLIRSHAGIGQRFTNFPHSIQRIFSFTHPLPLPILLAFAALGAARYQIALPDLTDPTMLARFNDQVSIFQVDGVLVEPPDVRATYTNLRLESEAIRHMGESSFQSVHGVLLARVAFSGDWRYGDRLRLQGRLVTPPEFEGFSYRDFLYRQDIYTLMDWADVELLQRGQGRPWLAAIYALRDRALSTLYRLYPDPEASLLAGILLGVETGIPRQVSQAFQDTGTAHIIAISG